MKVLGRIICFLMAIGLCCPIFCAAAQEEGEVLFEDHFDGAQKDQWTQFWGEWTFGGEENGLSFTTRDASQTIPKIITGLGKGWKNYIIEVDLEGVANGGIVFRSGNPVPGYDGFDGYFVGYDSAYAFFGKDVNGWQSINNGGAQAVAAQQLPYKQSMHWKLVVNGNTFTLYVDDMDTPFIQVYDSTFTEGGVGLRGFVTEGASGGAFKNFKVTAIPDDQVTYTDETKGTYGLWSERLVAQNPAQENQNKVMLIGHSHMEFWHSCHEDFGELEVLNFGMGGSWVDHLEGKNDLWLTPYNPSAVVVMIGGNDISGGRNPIEAGNRIVAYLKTVRESLPDTPIFFISPFGRLNQHENRQKQLQAAEITKEYCETADNIHYIHVCDAIDYTDASLYLPDAIHLNDKGYDILAAHVVPAVEAVLKGSSEPEATQTQVEPSQPAQEAAPAPASQGIAPWAVIAVGLLMGFAGFMLGTLFGGKKKK